MQKSKSVEEQLLELQKTVQTLVIVVFVLVLGVGGLFLRDSGLFGKAQVAGANIGTNPVAVPQEQFPLVEKGKYPLIEQSDHVRDNNKGQYVLIEYSDLECPFCKRFHPTIQAFLEENKNNVAWVYRHFPLDSIHPQARNAAVISECVAKIGGNDAFWSFIDEVFKDTPDNTGLDLANKLTEYVAATGLDYAQVSNCYEAKETKDIVERHAQEGGTKYNIQGTPGSYLTNTKNGKTVFISGALDIFSMKEALKKVQ